MNSPELLRLIDSIQLRSSLSWLGPCRGRASALGDQNWLANVFPAVCPAPLARTRLDPLRQVPQFYAHIHPGFPSFPRTVERTCYRLYGVRRSCARRILSHFRSVSIFVVSPPSVAYVGETTSSRQYLPPAVHVRAKVIR